MPANDCFPCLLPSYADLIQFSATNVKNKSGNSSTRVRIVAAFQQKVSKRTTPSVSHGSLPYLEFVLIVFDLEFTLISKKSIDRGDPEDNHTVVGSASIPGSSLAPLRKPLSASSERERAESLMPSRPKCLEQNRSLGADFWPLVTREEQKGGLRLPQWRTGADWEALLLSLMAPLKPIKNVLWSVHGHFLTHIFHSDGIGDQPRDESQCSVIKHTGYPNSSLT